LEPGAERKYPIPPGDNVTIDRQISIIVVRYQGQMFAFNLSCPHQNAAVKWLPSDRRFQCTKHDSQYTPVGVYTSGRATRNMDRLPIRREGDSVLVDVDRMIQSDKDPAGWAAATVAV
jgi:Rieske Fe-S protein